jgi:hypothetical protein
MDDPSEFAIVEIAFRMACGPRGYVSGFVEWSTRGRANSQRNLDEWGLTPEGVLFAVIEHVRKGGKIKQAKETEAGRDRPYRYEIILDLDGIPRGLYVKLRIHDDRNPESPTIHIVSAHRQGV